MEECDELPQCVDRHAEQQRQHSYRGQQHVRGLVHRTKLLALGFCCRPIGGFEGVEGYGVRSVTGVPFAFARVLFGNELARLKTVCSKRQVILGPFGKLILTCERGERGERGEPIVFFCSRRVSGTG